MIRIIFILLVLLGMNTGPSAAAVVWRSYNYFSVGGSTLDDMLLELNAHGPKVSTTGQRHAGATRMKFNTRLEYIESDSRCHISAAAVTIRARIILPKWRERRKANREQRIYWDTLSADIKRHEEGHIVIAKNYAWNLERNLVGLEPRKNCPQMTEQAENLIDKALAAYKKESDLFDRVESASFDRRIQSLYDYRVERIESGRLPEP